MSALTRSLGQVSYNGFQFNNRTVTEMFSVRPQFDGSGRTTAYCVVSVKLRTDLDDLFSTDVAVRVAVQALSHPGGVFVYRGRGLGNPDINTGGIRDVKWGPKPGPIDLSPRGEGNAVTLKWSVEFCIPCCEVQSMYQGNAAFRPVELVYTVEHENDPAGFTTRRIAGYLIIANNRAAPGSSALADSADHYRGRLVPPLLQGYRRIYGPWRTSEDRSRLDFLIMDEEMGGEALPRNVVEAELSESISSSEVGLRKWNTQITATYRMRKGCSGLDAARVFFAYLKDKLTKERELLKGLPTDDRGDIIPTGFSMTNPNRYGKPTAQFSFSYFYTTTLKQLLTVSRMFQPRGKDTWQAWAESMSSTGQHPYGGSRLEFFAGEESLVGLCESSGADQQPGQTSTLTGTAGPPPESQNAEIKSMYEQAVTTPDPPNSWVHYECEISLETDAGTVSVRRLPSSSLTSSTDLFGKNADVGGAVINGLDLPQMPAAAGGGDTAPAAGSMYTPPTIGTLQPSSTGSSSGSSDALRRTAPVCYVYLRGVGIRAGYPVDPPRLLTVNGVEAIPANRLDRGEGMAKGIKANAHVPLHYTRWNLRYLLNEVPTGPLPVPPNPTQKAS